MPFDIPLTKRNTIDLDGLHSIIHSDSTFNFIRKKNRNVIDNFDFIESFYEEGKHIKPIQKLENKTLDKLKALKESFPNFEEVITYIEKQLFLKQIGNEQIKLEPMFLHGEPGIGKTELILSLSEVLNLSIEKINASTLSGSFSLAGSESQWADSAPGLITKSMIKHRCANYILYLDELDKVQEHLTAGNPLNALYDLLEERSALKFVDMAFGDSVFFDTSKLNIIASGNDKDSRTLHPAILSRFSVFEVPQPSEKQMASIIQNIHQGLLKKSDWGHHFDTELSDKVIEKLVQDEGSVRNVKRILKDAYIDAYKAERRHLTVDDIHCRAIKSIPMGFR